MGSQPERSSCADVVRDARFRTARTGTLGAIRDALLPKLLSGAIRVRAAAKAVEKVT